MLLEPEIERIPFATWLFIIEIKKSDYGVSSASTSAESNESIDKLKS